MSENPKYCIWWRLPGQSWNKTTGAHGFEAVARQHLERWQTTYPEREYALLPEGERPVNLLHHGFANPVEA